MSPRKQTPEQPDARLPQNTALRASITELETYGNEYADVMLGDTPVHVDLHNISGNFRPPNRALAIFRSRHITAPEFVNRINIDLDYDNNASQFSVSQGSVMFDNGHGVVIQDPVFIEDEGATFHAVGIMRYGPRIRPKLTPVTRWPSEVVQGFFTNSGLDMPLAPLQARAGWDAVLPTINQAQHSVVTAQKHKDISSDSQLIVTEQVVHSAPIITKEDMARYDRQWLRGRSHQFRADASKQPIPHERVTVRELSVQLVDYSSLAVRSVEALLRSNSLKDKPKFVGVYLRDGIHEINPPINNLFSETRVPETRTAEGELVTDNSELSKAVRGIMQALRKAGGKLLG